MAGSIALGLDIGTAGVRACAIGANGSICARARLDHTPATAVDGHSEQDAGPWREAAHTLIRQITAQCPPASIGAIAIDGTSSTLLLCAPDGTPLTPALMYNDQRSTREADMITRHAPGACGAHGASSSLAKLLYLMKRQPNAAHACHQADWVAASLHGRYDVSDANNCLKLGYDSVAQCWPGWLAAFNLPKHVFPAVQLPGTVVGPVLAPVARELGLTEDCVVVAGTTDSVAALVATGADTIGDAVTSLGSTLVVKVISEQPVYVPAFGVYSHRLGDQWLVGGASNSGGRVLQQFFSNEQMDKLAEQVDPTTPTGLDYYPLTGRGERFPVNDPDKQPELLPRPADDAVFFQGLLEGIARIEAAAYHKLTQLGAARPQRVITAGGGSKNEAWRIIRENMLGVPVLTAEHSEACYGSALLALKGLNT